MRVDGLVAAQHVAIGAGNTIADNGDQWNLSTIVRIWSSVVAALMLAAIGLALAARRRRPPASSQDIDVLDLSLLVSHDFAPDGRLLKIM